MWWNNTMKFGRQVEKYSLGCPETHGSEISILANFLKYMTTAAWLLQG